MSKTQMAVEITFPQNPRMGRVLVGDAELNFQGQDTLLITDVRKKAENEKKPMSEWNNIHIGYVKVLHSTLRGESFDNLHLSGIYHDFKKDRILEALINIRFFPRGTV